MQILLVLFLVLGAYIVGQNNLQLNLVQQASPSPTAAQEPTLSPKLESTPTPKPKSTALPKPGQQLIIEEIGNELKKIKAELDNQKKIMDEERNPYCLDKFPDDFSAANTCEAERLSKFRKAEGQYYRLQEEFRVLYYKFLDIAGQK